MDINSSSSSSSNDDLQTKHADTTGHVLHQQKTPVIGNNRVIIRDSDKDSSADLIPVPFQTSGTTPVARSRTDDGGGSHNHSIETNGEDLEERALQARRIALLEFYGASPEQVNKVVDSEEEDSSSDQDFDIVAQLLQSSTPPRKAKQPSPGDSGATQTKVADVESKARPNEGLATPVGRRTVSKENSSAESFAEQHHSLRKTLSTESLGREAVLSTVGQERSTEMSIPQHVEWRSGFDVDELKPWVDSDSTVLAKNCFGVVHVRVLRAQNLPCPVSSVVQTILHLHPWKGKVRIQEKAIAMAGKSSVCVQWETEETTAMVHAYSADEDSPIPEIQIDLAFTPFGMFEFTMCSITLSCKPLLQFPNVPKRQWVTSSSNRKDPLIEVEAMFEPVDDEEDDIAIVGESIQKLNDLTEHTDVGETTDLSDKGSLDGSFTGLHVDNASTTRASSKASTKFPVDDGSALESSSLHSMRKTDVTVKTNRHQLQLTTFRIPSYCCVCGNSLMSGLWKKIALRCELCTVDCCDDCRLQVAIQLPCGSDAAKKAVEEAVQNKFTVDRFMSVVAPVDESAVDPQRGVADGSKRTANHLKEDHGVGTMKLEFIKAHVLKDHLPADETDPLTIVENTDLMIRPGDYYIRVSWTGSNKTTRTCIVERSKGRPHIDSGTMLFVVPHYGTEFRIELIDATTDKPIGASLITTQGLLQQQRDYLIEEKRVPLLSFIRPTRFMDMRRIVVGLRTGLKNGFGSDFFDTRRAQSSSSDVKAGDIVGCIEMKACFEEDWNGLFAESPYECPQRPGEELDMSVIQLHLARISTMVDDAKLCLESYRHIISWKNPLLTGCSLCVYVQLCIWFNPAYFGSGPIFLAILCMVYFGIKRSYSKAKQSYINKEIEKNRKAQNGTVDYDVHRPVGIIRISVHGGQNIRSPELGLPGHTSCRMLWDPSRYLSIKMKEKAFEVDESTGAVYEIGSTHVVYSSNPMWETMRESIGTRRLKSLLPSQGAFFDKATLPEAVKELEFPVLQPIGINDDLQYIKDWSSAPAAVTIELLFSDLLNILPGSEQSLGEVTIPFSDLVKSGKLSGWYDVVLATQPHGDHVASMTNKMDDKSPKLIDQNIEQTQLRLSISWIPPEESDDLSIVSEREASFAIQEEMVRLAHLIRQRKEKLSIVDSSIGALNTVRGISANLQAVQNTLGSVLDLVESGIHAFDFTDPFKSTIVLAFLIILWLILSLISTRLILLLAGVAQYSVTLKARLERWLRSDKIAPTPQKKQDLSSEQEKTSPVPIWFMNALRGLPTSEDLRKCYFWESKRLGAQESETLAAEKRRSRLQRLWRVQWYSKVRILSLSEQNESEWRTVFAMIQGHRLLWWRSVGHFDDGLPPLGRLFLAGHAGLASPSPLEMRFINSEDLNRVVCLFGSGSRSTLLTPTRDVKIGLERAVEMALSSKQD